jgi:serine/threonine protein kinase
MTVTPRAGDEIGHYRLERLLGQGGMAMVFIARDLVLERPVAVKVIAPRIADDERFRDRFLRESRLAARIEHPNIVPVYSAGEVDGLLYIAMRYINGSDFESMLDSSESRSRLLPIELILSIMDPVGDALDTAHTQGLVHRDVKPANILLEQRRDAYDVYLSDFGIAKAIEGTRHTVDGDVLGTPSYIAPEQALGRPVDNRTDVYAMGCVLYRCLVGRPPFARDHPLAELAAHYLEPVPAMSATLTHLAPLDPVLARALAKDPDDRPSSCAELLAELRGALATLDGDSTVAIPTTQLADWRNSAGSFEDRKAESADEGRVRAGRPARRRYAYVASGLALLAALAFVGGRVVADETGPTTTADSLGTGDATPAIFEAEVPDPPVSNGFDGCTPPNVQNYGADKLFDKNNDTAWRMEFRDPKDLSPIKLRLAESSRVSEVGLIPGFAKTDPCDETDRFSENRRITQVRWTIGEVSVVQNLDPDNRKMQSMRLPLSPQGKVVELQILAVSEDPTPEDERDFITISEVSVT